MNTPIYIGSRRELFADRFLIDTLNNLEHVLHHPWPAGDNTEPLRGSYVTIIQDGKEYKRFYRENPGEGYYDGHPDELTCLDVSRDGIHWKRPELGVFKPVGENRNIVWAGDPPRNHNFSPFLDENPEALPEERYKALAGTHKDDNGRPADVPPLPDIDSGLYAFSSPDGIHWKKMAAYPVMTFPEYAFDSQNITFWSEAEECYVCYFRCWEENPLAEKGHEEMNTGEKGSGEKASGEKVSGEKASGEKRRVSMRTHQRSIARSTSKDYLNWSEPVRMKPNFPGEHLYTSQIHPYYRAPHIYIALPTRFMPERGSSTDIMFMTARGGGMGAGVEVDEGKFDRTFTGAFVKPGPDPAAWGNRSNYASLNTYQTSPTELSFYVRGIRRILRIDGFAGIRSFSEPGTLITKPFIFTGTKLFMNYAASAAGSIKVSFLTPDGVPVTGFCAHDSIEVVGDEIDGVIPFKAFPGLGSLSGKPVRMQVWLKEAEIFSFTFN
jgi:hypothetical protein